MLLGSGGFFVKARISKLDDYFLGLSSRNGRKVYRYRINGVSEEVSSFVGKYYALASKSGAVIDHKLQNPDFKATNEYLNAVGSGFSVDKSFFAKSVGVWLKIADQGRSSLIASALFDSCSFCKKCGDSDSKIKNTFIKYMCWLKNDFWNVVQKSGGEDLPKILYVGNVSQYELLFLEAVSNTGCDVLFIQYDGDARYLEVDPSSKVADNYDLTPLKPFEPGTDLIKDAVAKGQREEAYSSFERKFDSRISKKMRINAFCSSSWSNDILKPLEKRSGDSAALDWFCYCIDGVENQQTYMSELFQFQNSLKKADRGFVVVNGSLPVPTLEEVGKIRRDNYGSIEQMAVSLSVNIQFPSDSELENIMKRAFVREAAEVARREEGNINKVQNEMIVLLCWLKRYQHELFKCYLNGELGCFASFDGCKEDKDSDFLKMLSMMPVDIIIFSPVHPCRKIDRLPDFKTIKFGNRLDVKEFPMSAAKVDLGTATFQAEKEVGSQLSDVGMYRRMQHKFANTVTLKTTYDEIGIYWDEELSHRKEYEADGEEVSVMPVIFSKISGVKDGNVKKYWEEVYKFITPNAKVVSGLPFYKDSALNPFKHESKNFLKDGKLQIDEIRKSRNYDNRLGTIRGTMQDIVFDRIQQIIDNRMIRDIGETGVERTIVEVALNLPSETIRTIQNFDLAKKNPKFIFINTTEKKMSLEDSIFCLFVHLIGFDCLFFIPNGCELVEKYYTRGIQEQRIGDNMYDLQVPNWDDVRPKGFLERLKEMRRK